MKNKLGVIGAIVLTVIISGSAFAANHSTNVKAGSKTAATKTAVKRHRHHRKHHKHHKMMTKKADTPMQTPPTK